MLELTKPLGTDGASVSGAAPIRYVTTSSGDVLVFPEKSNVLAALLFAELADITKAILLLVVQPGLLTICWTNEAIPGEV